MQEAYYKDDSWLGLEWGQSHDRGTKYKFSMTH